VNAQQMKAFPERKTDVKDAEWICPTSSSQAVENKFKDMLYAIAKGEDDPVKLASFARQRYEKEKEKFELALRGYVNPHQRMMLKTILTHIDFLTEQIDMFLLARKELYVDLSEEYDKQKIELLLGTQFEDSKPWAIMLQFPKFPDLRPPIFWALHILKNE